MKKSATTKGGSPSRLIDARIKELDDWRGTTLSHVRAIDFHEGDEIDEDAFKTLIRAASAYSKGCAASALNRSSAR